MNSKCKCGMEIPSVRISMGYQTCVKCSTVESYGCIDIVYHKTGNTVQVVDKSTSVEINKLSRRTGFGVMRGMKSGSASTLPKTKISNSPVGVDPFAGKEKLLNEWGEKAMIKYELYGAVDTLKYIEQQVKRKEIPEYIAMKIKRVIEGLEVEKLKSTAPTKKINYGAVNAQINTVPQSEIDWIFKNYKK